MREENRIEPGYHPRPYRYKWWVAWLNIPSNALAWLCLGWMWLVEHWQECAGYTESQVNAVPEYEE